MFIIVVAIVVVIILLIIALVLCRRRRMNKERANASARHTRSAPFSGLDHGMPLETTVNPLYRAESVRLNEAPDPADIATA